MKRSIAWGAAAIALSLGLGTAPARAQLFLTPPDFGAGPIDGSDPLVGIPVPGATATEHRAHLLWNFRAGLNVAALQCQFSPFLRVVDNYNGILAHHGVELATAYTALNAYFRRVHGARGQKLFDDYSTATYNNFSTLQAQYGFCQTASNAAKAALATPKGDLHLLAVARMRPIRGSLRAASDRAPVYNALAMRFAPLPSLREQCWTKKDVLQPRCGGPRTR